MRVCVCVCVYARVFVCVCVICDEHVPDLPLVNSEVMLQFARPNIIAAPLKMIFICVYGVVCGHSSSKCLDSSSHCDV